MAQFQPPPGRGPTMPAVHPDVAGPADGKRDTMPARFRRYAGLGPFGPAYPGAGEGKRDTMPARFRRWARKPR